MLELAGRPPGGGVAPWIDVVEAVRWTVGIELQKVVDYVTKSTCGLAAVDLARLNLRVGKPLSRFAMSIPDTQETITRAWQCARAIVAEGGKT